MIIYQARNKINGKRYIGKCVGTMLQRKREHLRAIEQQSQLLFHRAIRKYGKEAFEWKVIMQCESKDDLEESEIACIKLLKTKTPNGYNCTDGGEGGCGNHSEETRKKIGVKSKLKWGRPGNPVCIEAMANVLRGSKRSEEFKENLRRINTGRIYSSLTRKRIGDASRGRKASLETRAKMSKSRMGHPTSDETKRRISASLLGSDKLKQASVLNKQKRVKALKQWNRYRDWESCYL